MNINDKASILYDYVVSGFSMENISYDDDYSGITTSEVSALVRSYGFNYENQGSYRSGQHRGEYKNGYIYTYKGYRFNHKVSLQDLTGFVKTKPNASLDYPCAPDAFEDYLDKYVVSNEAAEILKKQEREKNEQQRRLAEQQRKAKEEEQRRLAEQRRRAAEEEQRRLTEQRRRAAEEEQRRKNQWQDLCNEGERLYKANQMNDALAKFRQAEKLYTSDWLNWYIAYTLAKFSNSSSYASEIRDRMNKVISANGYTPTYNDYYYLANALLDLGDIHRACDNYFFAGDIAYDKKDFILADKTYTEALNKTKLYSSYSKNAQFRIAYAMSKRENLTDSDRSSIITWYNRAIEKGMDVGWCHNNIAWEYINCKQYEQARDSALKAIDAGNTDKIVYGNLVSAYWYLKDYDGVIETSNQAIARGYDAPNYFRLGYSYRETGNDEKAEWAYKESIRRDIAKPTSCWNLSLIYKDNKRYFEAVNYAEQAITFFSQEERDKHGAAALKIAKLANDMAAYERMLQYLPKERDRIEQERLEKDRLEKERLEKERLEKERLEKERLEKERLEKERLEKERLEKERLEKEKQKKLALSRRYDEELLLLF